MKKLCITVSLTCSCAETGVRLDGGMGISITPHMHGRTFRVSVSDPLNFTDHAHLLHHTLRFVWGHGGVGRVALTGRNTMNFPL
jgi:hypothetical protein